MDTTGKYIEMSEKAEEIQEEWEPIEGDYYCYQDIMCGHPVYIVNGRNLKDVHKTDVMKLKDIHCPVCRYDYDSFQGIMASTKAKADDAVTGRFVWLPRQDQLQEIWGRHIHGDDYDGSEGFFMLDCFQCFILDDEGCGKDTYEFTKDMDTLEQLWLVFVMREKYGKKWVDGEWILAD